MSDKPAKVNPNQPAGQPVGDPSQGAEPSGMTDAEYITRDEALKMIEDVRRQSQSLVDKSTARTNERIRNGLAELDRVLKAQRGMGIEIDPQHEQALRQSIISEAYSGNDDQGPSEDAQPNAPAGTQDGSADPLDEFISNESAAILKRAGVDLEDDDPEIKLLQYHGTTYDFLRSVENAARTKAERLGQQPEQQPRTPASFGGGGTPPPDTMAGKSLSDIWALVEKRGL